MRMSRSFVIPAVALTIGLAVAPGARADFAYISTVNVATAPTLPSNPPGFGAAVIGIGAGNSLTFTTNAGAGIDGTLPGGADINFGTIVFNASGSGTVVSYGVNFNYAVTITDETSGETGTVNFTGLVSGFARGTPRAINSTISNYQVSPQELILGGLKYTVSIGTSTGPGSLFDGVLQGNVQVTPVPEPSSMALVGIGLAGTLAVVRRRRRGHATA